MNVLVQETTQRGARLLVAHCESLDPRAVRRASGSRSASGNELARKLVFALAPPARSGERPRSRAPAACRRTGSSPRRRTKSQIAANETSAITIAVAPLAPTARSPK